jgi:hypothetical protein
VTWVGANDIIAAVQSQLGSSVTINVGVSQKALNVAPPAIWAFMRRERYGAPQGAGAGYNARNLHARELDIEFHSWGVDVPMTEQIHLALVSAIRAAGAGATYRLNDAEWIEQQNIEYGPVLVMPVTFQMALPQQTLPLTLPGSDAKYQTVVVTSEAPDTSPPNPAGILYRGEG